MTLSADLLGSVIGMYLFGLLIAKLLQKLFTMTKALSYVIGVVAMTFIGAAISVNLDVAAGLSASFLEPWIRYAIAGAIALPILLIVHRPRTAN